MRPTDRLVLQVNSNRISCGLQPIDWIEPVCNFWLFLYYSSSHAFSSTLVLIPFIELDIILTYERRNLESIKSLSPCVILHSIPSRKSPIVHLHFISSSFHHFFLFLATFACTNTFPWLSNKYVQIWPNMMHKTHLKTCIIYVLSNPPHLSFARPRASLEEK